MNNKFHEHLDKCNQCRNHPFNLCPIGRIKLQEAVTDISNKDLEETIKNFMCDRVSNNEKQNS